MPKEVQIVVDQQKLLMDDVLKSDLRSPAATRSAYLNPTQTDKMRTSLNSNVITKSQDLGSSDDPKDK